MVRAMVKFCQSLMYAPAEDWVELTRTAESVGFDQVSLSDHVFYPETLNSKYPYRPDGRPLFRPHQPWPDVWVMTGALASVTDRIRFATHVYVLPARNPFVVAKAAGTAAWASGGRVVLGIGAGWMKEEFDALGQPYEGRGARMEEQVEVLRSLWQGGMVEYHGKFYDFEPVNMSPAPAEPVPVLVGGHSEVALRRAARIGDGWMGTYYTLDELRGYVERLQGYRREYGTEDRPFEIQASILDVPSREVCAQLDEMGVNTLITSAWLMAGLKYATLDENRAALEEFAVDYMS
jgi:probable F420-dependent oxidoreductase